MNDSGTNSNGDAAWYMKWLMKRHSGKRAFCRRYQQVLWKISGCESPVSLELASLRTAQIVEQCISALSGLKPGDGIHEGDHDHMNERQSVRAVTTKRLWYLHRDGESDNVARAFEESRND